MQTHNQIQYFENEKTNLEIFLAVDFSVNIVKPLATKLSSYIHIKVGRKEAPVILMERG